MRENYELKNEYTENIPKLLDTDPASATDTFNPLFQKIINNIHSNKTGINECSSKTDEVENMIEIFKGSIINSMNNNIFLENFEDINSVKIVSGIYDSVSKKIYV